MASLDELFLQMWILDYQMGLFGKDYFQGLVKSGDLSPENYKKVTGEDYVAPAQPTQPAGK